MTASLADHDSVVSLMAATSRARDPDPRHGRRWCLVALLLPVLLIPSAHAEDDHLGPRSSGLIVEPDHVDITLLFGGRDLTVCAEIPRGYDAGVRLIGPRQRVELQRKGRIWGLLWTGVEEITLDDVPAVYLLATSAPLADLAPKADLVSHDLGYAALVSNAGPEGHVFRELIKLRQSEGLYAEDAGGLALTESSAPDRATLVASFRLPARIPPGTYAIEVFGFQGGSIHEAGTAMIQVEQVGLARFLRLLAMQHGLLYGCAAVIIAVIAGLLTGLIFGLRSGKRRVAGHRTGG